MKRCRRLPPFAVLFILFLILPFSAFGKSQERGRHGIENISDTDIIIHALRKDTRNVTVKFPLVIIKNSVYYFLRNTDNSAGHLIFMDYFFESLNLYDDTGSLFMTLEDIREDSFVTEMTPYPHNYTLLITQQDIEEGRKKYADQPGLDIAGGSIEFGTDSYNMVYYAQDEPLSDTGPPENNEWVIENGTLMRYRGIQRNVIIPRTVTAIGEGAFKGTQVISVEIPDTVVFIGDSAFEICRSLRTVIIPESVNAIGKSAFYRCISLRSIRLPESLAEISPNTFALCVQLEQVELPQNLISIGDEAFLRCTALAEISLPQSLVRIGNSVFAYCAGIKSLVIPASLSEMGGYIFMACDSLDDLTLSPGLPYIGAYMFAACRSLKSVVLPASVEEVGERAFMNCKELKEIILSRSTRLDGDYIYLGTPAQLVYRD